jgi:hypothetical protein
VIAALFRGYHDGSGPISLEALRDRTRLSSVTVRCLLDYLVRNRIAVECVAEGQDAAGNYTLARDIDSLSLEKLLLDYFKSASASGALPVDKAWRKSLDIWASSFEKIRVADLAK